MAGFAGELIHINLSLLAHAVQDDPAALVPDGGTLVSPQPYVRLNGATVIGALQPFAFTSAGGDPTKPVGLPIGPNLQRFLDDPLDGERLDLTLPFYDESIELAPNGGGWFRNNSDDRAFHAGTDLVVSPRGVFDVCAAADGRVVARAGDNILLSHTSRGGREFRTVYVHMDLSTAPHALGDTVRRGELLGRIDPTVSTIHLHFGVAVSAPAFTLGGAAWYFIDPWGVYDLRANNYLPETARIFENPIIGATHTVQWRAEPVFKVIPIARSTDGYRRIDRIQVRARQKTNFCGTLPAEHDQFLVWLDDDPDFFLVPLSQATDQTTELELATLLRQAFFDGKSVRLEYRYVGDLRYIMAAWVNA